jgi:hypothetical protein
MTARVHILTWRPGFWPVLHREISQIARRPHNYWIRVLGGLAAMIMTARVMENNWNLNPVNPTALIAVGGAAYIVDFLSFYIATASWSTLDPAHVNWWHPPVLYVFIMYQIGLALLIFVAYRIIIKRMETRRIDF